jgi:ATP synthase protein I
LPSGVFEEASFSSCLDAFLAFRKKRLYNLHFIVFVALSRTGRESKMAERKDDRDLESDALHRRLETLSHALKVETDKAANQKAKEDAADLSPGSVGAALSLGFRVLTEFVAAVVVGALIGWQIDAWVHVSPLFLLVFLGLGTAAGFWNVYRIASKPTKS